MSGETAPDTPRHSIACVIPTHGRPDYLERSLASVLAQTRPPDEIVVVDDLDTAASAALVEQIAAERGDSIPVRYVPIANRPGRPGASRSRNAGVRAATSSVIGFLDDDDEWLPDFLRATETTMSEGDYDAVTAWMLKRSNETELDGRLVRPGLSAGEVLSTNPGFTGSTFIITRKAFDAVGGFDEQLPVSNDKDFLYRLLSSGHRLGVVQERLVRRHLDTGGRLGSGGMSRAAAIAVYLRKHDAVLTASDRRGLERDILMNLRRDVPSRLVRVALVLAASVRTGTPAVTAFVRRRRLARARQGRSGRRRDRG